MLPASRTPSWLPVVILTLAVGLLTFFQLGSPRAPRTYCAAWRNGEAVTADLGEVRAVERVCAYIGLGAGSYLLELSADGRTWSPGLTIDQESLFGMVEWRALPLRGNARYLRVTAVRPGLMLGEIALFGPDRRPIAAAVTSAEWESSPAPAGPLTAGETFYGAALPLGRPGNLFDEPRTAAYTPTHRTGMYFDETYFARSAWEGLLGLPVTETTHPPLGKLLVEAGLRLFGVTPFGWRFTSALAGSLSVPLLYLLARRLFRRPGWALAAATLFALDFMRFVQSRMATPEPFVLLFVLLFFWFLLGFFHDVEEGRGPLRAAGRLLAAGVCLGAGAASKWIGLYPAVPAVLLGLALLWRQARAAGLRPPGEPPPACRPRRFVLLGLVALIFVPAALYLASYLPLMLRQGWRLADVAAHQLHMFRYHSLVTETRWYASNWWQWPLLVRPVWLYTRQADLPAGWSASIATLGNPAIWWAGAAAVPALAGLALADLRRRRVDQASLFILLAFLGQYLPWVIAPRRLVFIYHFYTCVPFLVLGLVRLAERWAESRPQGLPVAARFWPAVAAGLFILFYPLLAGVPVGPAWARALSWFDTWIFYP